MLRMAGGGSGAEAASPARGGLPPFAFGGGSLTSPLRAGEGRVLPPPTWQGQVYEPNPQPLGSQSHFAFSHPPQPAQPHDASRMLPFAPPSPLPPPLHIHDAAFPPLSSRTFLVGSSYQALPHPLNTARPGQFFPPPLASTPQPWSNPSPSYQSFPLFQREPIPTPSLSASASASNQEPTSFLTPPEEDRTGSTSSPGGPTLEELFESQEGGGASLDRLLNDSAIGVDLGAEHGGVMAGSEDDFLLNLLWPA